jgi:hypothetical protein
MSGRSLKLHDMAALQFYFLRLPSPADPTSDIRAVTMPPRPKNHKQCFEIVYPMRIVVDKTLGIKCSSRRPSRSLEHLRLTC